MGAAQYVVTSDTSFREDLLTECPLIALQAVVTHDDSGRRASQVALYAVDKRFWEFHQRAVVAPARNEFLVSDALAAELSIQAGDNILVRVTRASEVPLESLHGRKDDPGRTVRGVARGSLSRDAMGEFSLRLQQGPVRAIFVNLDRFQRDLDMDGRVNAALTKSAPDQLIRGAATLSDLGIKVQNGMADHASTMLNDSRMNAIRKADTAAQPVFTYLANSIRGGGREIPYSVVTAMDRPELTADDQIVLNQWAARDLQAKPGETITLEYYLWNPSGKLETRTAEFRYSGTAAIEQWQRFLSPEYPGVSDALTMSDWDPPFPMNLGRIRKVDEEYWDRYRATPKAFIRLSAGQALWRSRYGAATGVRTTASPEAIRAQIDPLTVIHVEDVRQAASQASRGSTNFGEYFLYFSFFLVVSALLLAGMFFRFGIEQRLSEIATLRALGWSVAQVRKLLLTESLLVAAAGSAAGSIMAFLYSHLILYLLGTWWVDAVGTSDLTIVFSWAAVMVGILGGLLMAALVIYGALRLIGRRSPRESASRKTRAPIYAAILGIGGLSALAVGGAGGFFGAGSLLMAAVLTWLFGRLKRRSGHIGSIEALGIRYTAHRPGRAVLCMALIASATFLIVAVDSFRRGGIPAEGGYRYFAESAIPLLHDPNSPEGREALNLNDAGKWVSFRLRPGDDASCLNLYQPQNPRVVGSPESWLTLAPQTDGTISAAVDANTLTYVLHKKIGDVLQVGNARLKFVKALHDTVFQSEILIGDSDFQRVYPEEQGFRVFLIDAPAGRDADIEKALADYGLDATSVADRIAAFHRVENTYLSTFQSLGALGLLLGAIGMGAVILRNILERRRELAILRAGGYDTVRISRMILAENIFILAVGLTAGTVSALIAVIPTVLDRGGAPSVWTLVGLLTTVMLVGVTASFAAIHSIMAAPVLPALRSE